MKKLIRFCCLYLTCLTCSLTNSFAYASPDHPNPNANANSNPIPTPTPTPTPTPNPHPGTTVDLDHAIINDPIDLSLCASPVEYPFKNELIDVIIPTCSKDEVMLKHCIKGIKSNCRNIGRIIIVSPKRVTKEAEWFNERKYPFSKFDVALHLNQMDYTQALSYTSQPSSRVGWYYQQLLKLYAPFVIPGISFNVLIVDSDVVFFRPIDFINEKGGGNYATSGEHHVPYFNHTQKILPGLKRMYNCSGIVHHMLFQKPVLDDLFKQVESHHGTEFWKAFCLCVDSSQLHASGASEYEIYFNFVFERTRQVKIRDLVWTNSGDVNGMQQHRTSGLDFVAYHAYMRY